jgi:hypothetical protein
MSTDAGVAFVAGISITRLGQFFGTLSRRSLGKPEISQNGWKCYFALDTIAA